jgi:cell fate (sporulation/competence/biofilm development) regulator YlbF (YheA/YmcA/DUF963 family)
MNGEAQVLMEQLVEAVKRTQEYNQYQTMLENVKRYPDLYRRIGEFRRRSLTVQMTDCANPIEQNNALQNEFSDLQKNGLANEFMVAEHQYCMMLRELQGYFLDSTGLELGFLDDER